MSIMDIMENINSLADEIKATATPRQKMQIMISAIEDNAIGVKEHQDYVSTADTDRIQRIHDELESLWNDLDDRMENA